MYAGITIMNYPPKRTDDVYNHIRQVLVPFHENLRAEGLQDALFMVNPESCQGIGIAIWNDLAKLQEIEKGTSRDMSRQMRDAATAPTDYTQKRAQWVEDLGGGIASTDWYVLVGRVNFPSTLFLSGPTYIPSYAGLTIMQYPPKRTNDVYKHIQDVLVPFHTALQPKGLSDALFLVNPETCQGIGIAIWEQPQTLVQIEGGNSRQMALQMRDPSSAPTDYTQKRAEWVEDLGGGITSTDWYEVIGRVPPLPTGVAAIPQGGGQTARSVADSAWGNTSG